MNFRTSVVKQLNNISLDETSIIQIGDSEILTPSTDVIAVQREKAIFYENEFNYEDYFMFKGAFPFSCLEEDMEMIALQASPIIQVEKLEVSFIAAASGIHIGSTLDLQAESRVKNIRHLFRKEPVE
ncbi:MAG TPA: spore germination protein GerPE [Bacillota bacterium]|nr:spore germination protein GerPE [Bacillota bacterium]